MELERVSKVSSFIRNRVVLVIIGAIVLSGVMFWIGDASAKVSLNKELVSYKELESKIKSKNQELASLDKKIQGKQDEFRNKTINLENQLAGKEKEVNAALEALKQKDSIDSELNKLKSDLNSINNNVKEKQNELASLSTQIKVKNESPKTLPAGQFVVGKDIPAGRYKVLAIGRGSNFMVYDSGGNNVVNTIIYRDASDGGVSEYVTILDDGYIIDAHSSFKYVPVE